MPGKKLSRSAPGSLSSEPRKPPALIAVVAALMAPTYRDETLEQFRSAARPHGLQVVSLASPGGEPAEPGQAEMLWPAEAFSAFTPHTTSEVFLVEVRLAFG